jgi:DNA-binding PadR family transcriptional regulator
MYILTVLGAGPSHGYRIMTSVDTLSASVVTLGPGTLYGSLRRMVGQGLIEETEERPDPELDDERRRYYQLTPFGAEVAAAELDRIATLADAARSTLQGRPTRGLAW